MGVTGLAWAKQQQFKPTMLTTLVLSALCLSFIWMECEQQFSQQVVPAPLLKTHFLKKLFDPSKLTLYGVYSV